MLVYAHDASTGAKHEAARSIEAAALEERYGISFRDALVVQAARVS